MQVLKAHGYDLAKSREMEIGLANTGALLDNDEGFQKVAKELALAAIVTGEIGKKRAKLAVHNGQDGSLLGEANFSGANPRKIMAEVGRDFWKKLGGCHRTGQGPVGREEAAEGRRRGAGGRREHARRRRRRGRRRRAGARVEEVEGRAGRGGRRRRRRRGTAQEEEKEEEKDAAGGRRRRRRGGSGGGRPADLRRSGRPGLHQPQPRLPPGREQPRPAALLAGRRARGGGQHRLVPARILHRRVRQELRRRRPHRAGVPGVVELAARSRPASSEVRHLDSRVQRRHPLPHAVRRRATTSTGR